MDLERLRSFFEVNNRSKGLRCTAQIRSDRFFDVVNQLAFSFSNWRPSQSITLFMAMPSCKGQYF